jgi:hypothetical protein
VGVLLPLKCGINRPKRITKTESKGLLNLIRLYKPQNKLTTPIKSSNNAIG